MTTPADGSLMSIRDRLRPVFAQALELAPEADVDGLRHRDCDRWDSLAHLGLVVAIEDEFSVELDADQLIDMDSFEAAVQILSDLGVVDR